MTKETTKQATKSAEIEREVRKTALLYLRKLRREGLVTREHLTSTLDDVMSIIAEPTFSPEAFAKEAEGLKSDALAYLAVLGKERSARMRLEAEVTRPIFLTLSPAGRAAAQAAAEFRWVDSCDLHLAAKLILGRALDFVGHSADEVRLYDIAILLSNGVTSMKNLPFVLSMFKAAAEREQHEQQQHDKSNLEETTWDGLCLTTCSTDSQ